MDGKREPVWPAGLTDAEIARLLDDFKTPTWDISRLINEQTKRRAARLAHQPANAPTGSDAP